MHCSGPSSSPDKTIPTWVTDFFSVVLSPIAQQLAYQADLVDSGRCAFLSPSVLVSCSIVEPRFAPRSHEQFVCE